jgi:hypothetical protein
MLDEMGLLVIQEKYDEREIKEEIGKGVFIYSEKLKLYLYCGSLFITGSNNLPSKEDIIQLLTSYDEETYNRFWYLYTWLLTGNGNALCKDYEDSLREAKKLYDEEYGLYMGKRQYIELTADEKIELEHFIRANPDFMPREVCYAELYRLWIITDQEYDTLWKAARDAQESEK